MPLDEMVSCEFFPKADFEQQSFCSLPLNIFNKRIEGLALKK
jgi:hypothetical protein